LFKIQHNVALKRLVPAVQLSSLANSKEQKAINFTPSGRFPQEMIRMGPDENGRK
jgi:hypothetical protein